MARKAQYQTKQMAELLAFLKSVPGSHITVNDICDHFKKEGITVGMTTVYRHLERMVKQGVVAKYIIEGSSSACFEYIGGQDNCEPPSCYHCKCEKCGKLLHVSAAKSLIWDSTCWSTMGLKWILCGRYSTEFAASAGKQAADGQIIFVKEGKLWIKRRKESLPGLPVLPLLLSPSFLFFSSQKRPITTAQERIALSAPAFIGPNKH